jgi:hypothetical protein
MSLYEIQLVIPACILLTAVTSVWALLTTKRVRTLVVLIPILVTAGYGSFSSAYAILGYPTQAPFKQDHVYLYHQVDKAENRIYIWALTEKQIPRAFAIFYSKESEEKLNKAQKKREEGIAQIIKGDDKKRLEKNADRSEESLRIFDFDMSKTITK